MATKDSRQYRKASGLLEGCVNSMWYDTAESLGPKEAKARDRIIEMAVNIALDYGQEIGMAVSGKDKL